MTIISSSVIKSFVGFDAFFDELNKLADVKESNYPAYNLEKLQDNKYKITIAVAGFSIDKLSVEVIDKLLVVKAESINDSINQEYLYKGIAQRPFTKKFRLESNLKVENASLSEGILSIIIKKIIPEEVPPIRIKINSK